MAYALKNPWPVLSPNLNKKISAKQIISPENVSAEFSALSQLINGILNGSIPIDNLTVIGNQTTTQTANYTANVTDTIILMDSTGGTRTVTLPNAIGIKGKQFNIKDWKGQSATNNITISAIAGQTIDGASTKVLNVAYVSYNVASDGANWAII